MRVGVCFFGQSWHGCNNCFCFRWRSKSTLTTVSRCRGVASENEKDANVLVESTGKDCPPLTNQSTTCCCLSRHRSMVLQKFVSEDSQRVASLPTTPLLDYPELQNEDNETVGEGSQLPSLPQGEESIPRDS